MEAGKGNLGERIMFQAFSACGALGPAFAGTASPLREVFELYKAACIDVGDVPMCLEAFLVIFRQADHPSCHERTALEDHSIGRILARNKNHEYDPYVKQEDLEDLDPIPEATVEFGRKLATAIPGMGSGCSGQAEWARAVQKQMREAYAYANCNTFHLADIARRLVGEAVAKLGPDWKAELDCFTALADKIKEAPFAGLRWPLPVEQRITSWPRLALIGLEYRLAHITDATEKERISSYKDRVAKKVKSESDVLKCKSLAQTMPMGLMGKKALVEKASLTVAQRIMRKEPESSREEVLRLLTEGGIECAWRTYQEGLVNQSQAKGE